MGKIIQKGKEIKKPDRKSLWYLGIVLIIAIVVCVGFFYYYSRVPEISVDEELFKEVKRQKIIKKQLEELDVLMREMPPLTKKEIEGQIKNLEKGMPRSALTEEEIQGQLNQLDKLFKEIK